MEDKKDIVAINPLDKLNNDTANIVNEVIQEQDVNKVKDLTALFNLNIQKKNMVRVYKLHNLLDNVNDKIVERFEKRPEEITNKELIEFMNATQNAIDRANKTLDNIGEGNLIQLNQQNNSINVNVTTGENLNLDRASKTKILDVINSILDSVNNGEDESTIIDYVPEDDEDSDDIEIDINNEGEDQNANNQ